VHCQFSTSNSTTLVMKCEQKLFQHPMCNG
jgi:hypothetical protein